MSTLVSIIIPTYNRKNELLGCLDSVYRSSYNNIETIVVDNASIDGTTKLVRKLYPQTEIIELDRNTGVTGGRNVGAKIAKGDFILFLDSDVIIDKLMIDALVKVMLNDDSIGIVGPVIYYNDEPNRIWAAGTSIDLPSGRVHFNQNLETAEPFEVQVMPPPIMIRRKTLEEIGLFDNNFFAAFEDSDFCFKVKEVGLKVVCDPKAKAWHKIPVEKKIQELHVLSRSYYMARNRTMFMRKHASGKNLVVFLLVFMPLYGFFYTWRDLKRLKPKYIVEYWKGFFEGISLTL